MSRRPRWYHHYRRRWWAVLSSVCSSVVLVWPRAAFAAPPRECGFTDPWACLDGSAYNLYQGIAVALWSLDQMLLILAYQLDHLRAWLATEAFLQLYESIRQLATPLLQPVAVLAVTLMLLAFLLVPIIGTIGLTINIRQVFLWVVIAPIILSEAGQWMLEAERWRSDMSSIMITQTQQMDIAGIFGGSGAVDDSPILAPKPLYAAFGGVSACPKGTITLPSTASAGAQSSQDMVAAMLLATAQDIHCPQERGGSGEGSTVLPDAFVTHFLEAGVADKTPADRGRAIEKIQRGLVRLGLGIFGCVVAVIESLIQLILTLCLLVVWLLLPLLAILVLFADTLNPIGMVIQRTIQLWIMSVLVSAIIGLFVACLHAAATTGSASALSAFAFGGLFIVMPLLTITIGQLRDTFHSGIQMALTSMGAAAMGGVVTGALGMMQRTAQAAVGAARRGLAATGRAGRSTAGAAATGMLAARSTGSGRYAVGAAMLGRTGLAPVGAVAASMGLISEEISAGMLAGERARRSGLGAAARQMQSDRQRKLSDGTTVRDRAQRRALQRQLARAEQPTAMERAEGVLAAARTFPSRAREDFLGGVHAARSAALRGMHETRDAATRGAEVLRHPDRIPGQIGRGVQRGVTTAIQGAATAAEQAGQNLRQRGQRMRAQDRLRRPGMRQQMAQRMNAQGEVAWSFEVPPDDALVVPGRALTPESRAGMLAAGYTIRNQNDGTTAIWKPRTTTPRQAESAPQQEQTRQELVRSGLLGATVQPRYREEPRPPTGKRTLRTYRHARGDTAASPTASTRPRSSTSVVPPPAPHVQAAGGEASSSAPPTSYVYQVDGQIITSPHPLTLRERRMRAHQIRAAAAQQPSGAAGAPPPSPLGDAEQPQAAAQTESEIISPPASDHGRRPRQRLGYTRTHSTGQQGNVGYGERVSPAHTGLPAHEPDRPVAQGLLGDTRHESNAIPLSTDARTGRTAQQHGLAAHAPPRRAAATGRVIQRIHARLFSQRAEPRKKQ